MGDLVASRFGIGEEIDPFRQNRRDIGTATHRATGPLVDRRTTDRTSRFQNFTAIHAPVSDMRRMMMRRTIEKIISNGIWNIGKTIAVRTESQNTLAPGHRHRRNHRLFFFLNERNPQKFRDLLDRIIRNLRRHSTFKHRNGGLLAANGLRKGRLIEALGNSSRFELAAYLWRQIGHSGG